MKVILVHNPSAGSGKLPMRRLAMLLRAYGHQILAPSHADNDLEMLLGTAADAIVAAGGDGTVAAVVRALPAGAPPLAIIPAGTANNIAHSLGIVGPSEAIIAELSRADRRTLDVWQVSDGMIRCATVEGCGLGALPLAAKVADDTLPDNLGEREIRAARVLLRRVVLDMEPIEATVILDGRRLNGDFLSVEAINGAYGGPRLPVAPGASASDGLIDVAVIEADRRHELAAWLAAGADRSASPFHVRRCRRLQIASRSSHVRLGDQTDTDSGASDLHLQPLRRIDVVPAPPVPVLVAAANG